MPTLYLLRHAKAEKAVKHAWDPADDQNRPLTASGIADALAVGRWFQEHLRIPGLAYVSPARRTRQTWEICQQAMGASVPTRIAPSLYAAHLGGLLELVRTTPAAFTSVILVGHDPSLSDLVGEPMSTATLARVELVDWGALQPHPDGVKIRKIRSTGKDA